MSFTLFLSCLFLATTALAVKIKTGLGEIEGTSDLKTRLGETIYAFRGIRYAQPPIDQLRFKRPVPTGKWTGTYNATADGAACPQPAIPNVPISEDCLFLNVYISKLSPNGPAGIPDLNRPVVVFLHGGAFSRGTAHSSVISPKYMLDQKIILVTLNYRLGALGFLAVNKEVPGNNGLFDQVMALQWVQNNILAFGGDRTRVCLYGFDAGGSSASLHLTSQLSRGLYYNIVFASGSMYGPYPIPNQQLSLAKKQARLVGCPDNTAEAIVKCLRTKTAKEIADTLPKFYIFGRTPIMSYSPVIEQDFGQQRFLTEHPFKTIKADKHTNCVVMAGISMDEFSPQAEEIMADPKLLQKLDDDIYTWAPVMLQYETNTSRSRSISEEVGKDLKDDEVGRITDFATPELVEFFADALVGFGISRALDIISGRTERPVFFYLFTYNKNNQPFGAPHGVEQQYLFPNDSKVQLSDTEVGIVQVMTGHLANFATWNDPNIDVKVNSEFWHFFGAEAPNFINIGENTVSRDYVEYRELFYHRYKFWENRFPIDAYY